MPDEPEVLGLLALMLLIDARRPARLTPEGEIIRLADQDRRQWNRDLINEGHAIVRRCLRRNQPGPYQVQAAINAVHCDASSAAGTDWRQILQLYDQLFALAPGPIVALNRAVAVAEVEGPEAALTLVAGLARTITCSTRFAPTCSNAWAGRPRPRRVRVGDSQSEKRSSASICTPAQIL